MTEERGTKLQKLEWRQLILGRGDEAFKVTVQVGEWIGIPKWEEDTEQPKERERS